MKLGVLFSGGKDSTYALYLAKKFSHEIACIITMDSQNKDSYMFHTPVDNVGYLAARMQLPLIKFSTQGKKEKELVDLKKAIKLAIKKYEIEGVVTGAVASTYQASRMQKICNELDIYCFNPLWQKNQIAFYGISLTTLLIKTSHLIDILETQGVSTAILYLEKLRQETSKASSQIINNTNINQAYLSLKSLHDYTHPKISGLISIINNQLSANKNSKIIVFVNFRDTINEILKELSKNKSIKPVALIGQKLGLKQKEQIQVIRDFENNRFNTLVCTSIGEEGLSISSLDIAVFYDSVPSAIRRIQRTGRVARIKPGKIIHLMAAGTKDVAYHWKSTNEEKKMKALLYKMQNKKEGQSTL